MGRTEPMFSLGNLHVLLKQIKNGSYWYEEMEFKVKQNRMGRTANGGQKD